MKEKFSSVLFCECDLPVIGRACCQKGKKERKDPDARRELARSVFCCNRDANAASDGHVGNARCLKRTAGIYRYPDKAFLTVCGGVLGGIFPEGNAVG